MAFLKLHNLHNVPFVINMNRIEEFRSTGAGGTELVYSVEGYSVAKESFEEVEEMLHLALLKPGIVSKLDIGAVVK